MFFQASSPDTLVVITGTCPHDGKEVPIFARGYGSERLISTVNNLHEVPSALRHILAGSNTVIDEAMPITAVSLSTPSSGLGMVPMDLFDEVDVPV